MKMRVHRQGKVKYEKCQNSFGESYEIFLCRIIKLGGKFDADNTMEGIRGC